MINFILAQSTPSPSLLPTVLPFLVMLHLLAICTFIWILPGPIACATCFA